MKWVCCKYTVVVPQVLYTVQVFPDFFISTSSTVHIGSNKHFFKVHQVVSAHQNITVILLVVLLQEESSRFLSKAHVE